MVSARHTKKSKYAYHSSCYLPCKGHRVSWMKCLTIVITLFLICLWFSILFLDRRPKHCHWDFALILIVKITLFSLLFLAVWSTRRSPTCFGVIWCVFNSLCILNNSRDKFEDTVIPVLSSPLLVQDSAQPCNGKFSGAQTQKFSG